MKSLRELYRIMKNDPWIAGEMPLVRRNTIKTLIWMLVAELVFVVQLYPLKYLINETTSQHPQPLHIIVIGLLIAALGKLTTELKRLMDRPRHRAFWGMFVIWWAYGHLRELQLSTDWHIEHGTGEKESVFGKNIDKIQMLIDDLIFEFLPNFVRIVFTVVLMCIIAWQYGLLAAAACVLFGLALVWAEHGIIPLRKTFLRDMKGLHIFGNELTNNWSTIKSLGLERQLSEQNLQMLQQFWRNEDERTRKSFRYFYIQNDSIVASRFGLHCLVAVMVSAVTMSAGTLLVVFEWMERLLGNFWSFTMFQRRMYEGREAARELVAAMLLPPTVSSPPLPQWPEPLTGRVQFEGVSFQYPNSLDAAIGDFSFEVEPYTSVGLVGYSGCGKTTLMKLLQRDYDPCQGRILIDGVDLKDLDYERWRQTISVVSQNVQLFSGTVADNIRISRLTASDEEVYEAARWAYCLEFIERLPGGFEAIIGENGVLLSGGQRQRLALARALLRQPPILILDEATSSLDALSQQHIQHTIDDLIAARRCTIFIIAHRFSTIMGTDLVVAMDNGHLAEIGTHDELARMNGLYRRLRDGESRGLLD